MLSGQFEAAENEWRRSRSCVGEGHCVEVSATDGGTRIRMRNSTSPDTVLVFDAAEWRYFLDAVKAGDLPLNH